MLNRFRIVQKAAVGVLATFIVSAPTTATTMKRHSLVEVAAHAEGVFVGTVSRKVTELDQNGTPWTLYTFTVEETLAGEFPGNTSSLRCMGGSAGGRSMRATGLPIFDIGERVLAFVDIDGNPLCQISGWELGVFRVRKDMSGSDLLVNEDGNAIVSLGVSDPVTTRVPLQPLPSASGRQRPLFVSGTDASAALRTTAAPSALSVIFGELRQFAQQHAKNARLVPLTRSAVGPVPMRSAARR